MKARNSGFFRVPYRLQKKLDVSTFRCYFPKYLGFSKKFRICRHNLAVTVYKKSSNNILAVEANLLGFLEFVACSGIIIKKKLSLLYVCNQFVYVLSGFCVQ